MHLTLAHVLIMSATLLIVIGGGIYAARAVKTAEGYSLGGRSSGAVMVAGSIAGTVVGGGATIGTAQLAYSAGLSAWWFTLGSGIAFIIMGLFYAGKLRMTGLETIPQYLQKNYGKKTAGLAGIISSIGILFSAVASCLPGIQMISAIFGTSIYISAIFLIILVACYVFFGGMKSAGVGGLLKMVVIWISLFAAGVSAFLFLHQMPAEEFNVYFPEAFWCSMVGMGIESALYNLFSMIVGILCTQTYVQCIFSAMTPRTAKIGAFLAAAIVIPVGLPSVAIGMYMHAFEPGVLPVLVLPIYLIEHQPVWLGGIALGGLILSLVGSIGGLSLGIGTMLTRDIIGKIWKIPEKKNLMVLRSLVVAVMAFAACIALCNMESQVLFWNYMSMALRGCGVFLPLTAAIFAVGKISNNGVFYSMLISTLVPLLWTILGNPPISPLFIGLGISGMMFLIIKVKTY